MKFEYKVVPAPRRGKKAKGAKSAADRFAVALSEVMNTEAAEGWEYLRTDTLPAEERQGLTGRSTVFQNMLVFRRPLEQAATAPRAAQETPGDAAPKAPKLPSATEAQDTPEGPAIAANTADGPSANTGKQANPEVAAE